MHDTFTLATEILDSDVDSFEEIGRMDRQTVWKNRREDKDYRGCLGDVLECSTMNLSAIRIRTNVFGTTSILVWGELDDHPFFQSIHSAK